MSVAVFTSYGQQFSDTGSPLSGGSVTVQQAGTTTPITLKSASDLSGSSAANPIVLDSAGRHDMRYFANQAYKVIVKNSSGVTIYTRDNIDPGIAIGTGDVAVVDGGTGASTAPAALSNLGGATSAEVAAIAAQVAAVTGALGSTAKTHIATGTTGQRDAVPVAGDFRLNTTTGSLEGYHGAAWIEYPGSNFGTIITEDSSPDLSNDFLLEYDASASTHKRLKLSTITSTKSIQETGTSTSVYVTPGVQHQHLSACKAFCKAGVTGSTSAAYNISSVTDVGVGQITYNIGNDYSSADWAGNVSVFGTGFCVEFVTSQTAGAISAQSPARSSGTNTDPTAWYFASFGVLA